MQDEELNFLEKSWNAIRKHTKVQESDPLAVKLFKWILFSIFVIIGIILSPVIAVVLIFALLLSL